MSRDHIFISHSSKDDAFVKDLREALESLGLEAWADSRELSGGDKLTTEIEGNIENARKFIVVVSLNALNSTWVQNEVKRALEVERRRTGEGYKVIPLMLPGIQPPVLKLLFGEEPVGLRVELKTGGLSEAMPAILAALGERLPADFQPNKEAVQQPVEELILKLTDMKIHEESGKRRARATATLIYEPADKSARAVESKRFTFTAPLGVIEAEDLRWYLEQYYIWPIGVFEERAKRIEKQLPVWGQDLYQSALAPQVADQALNAWLQAGASGERRFSILVDSELSEGAVDSEQVVAREAASELLSLPWELLHDGRGFLFHGKHPVLVRRRLPNRHRMEVRPTTLPIRILLVSPRPEEENRIGYIDHRISAKPLIEAVESLGELVTVTVLTPPTFPALEEALQKAAEVTQPFDVVHFDGHGVYDQGHGLHGLGALCFEDPNEMEKLERRKMQLVHAEKLAEVIRDHAFVSFEQYTDARGVLDSIGRQLLPEADNYSVSQYPALKQALQPVERALRDRATIIVLDNLESVLPNQMFVVPPLFVVPPSGGGSSSEKKTPPEGGTTNDALDQKKSPPEGGTTNEALDEILSMCRTLLDADAATRIVFTSRESVPAPFDKKLCERRLGPLDRVDAIKLVAEVMKQEGLTPKSDDPGSDPREIVELVEAVNCHARALVLLAREVSLSGVRATTENLHQLMAELHRKHPDDRENSLYASVELSLRRLPAELREQSRVLGVFHGGAHLQVLDYVLGTDADDVETVAKLAAALIEVGLAEAMSYGHVRLDPALPGYLLGQMSAGTGAGAVTLGGRLEWTDGLVV